MLYSSQNGLNIRDGENISLNEMLYFSEAHCLKM